MVAALAGALCFGAVVATFAAQKSALLVVWATLGGLVGALAIAALLTLAIVAVQALAGRRRGPSRGVIAGALVFGGLVMFPVHQHFYDDAESAAVGGSVGRCSGVLTLAQVVRNSIKDEVYGEISYIASCED
jgi:hypothetical protein